VNHIIGEYERGRVHTNTVEGEFSVFRPWNATFRCYSKENIHLYAAHCNFIRNNRHIGQSAKNISNANSTSAKILMRAEELNTSIFGLLVE
jgi:hypothetical protein